MTAVDVKAGRIRIPIGSTKRLFPLEKAVVELSLRGQRMQARWDPRHGPDRERSGVISIPKTVLVAKVTANEVLEVRRGPGGLMVLK